MQETGKTAPDLFQADTKPSYLAPLLENVDATYRGLSLVTFQRAAQSNMTTANSQLDFPSSSFTTELRPDFRFSHHRVELSLKPRAIFEWHRRDKEGESESVNESEFFINEWLVRVGLADQFLISYGRENLQWGPSFLFSPSNPFFKENGRLRLNKEVRGRDFARITWLPSSTWTVSAIANSSTGAAATKNFSPVYALKLDWSGEVSYASLVASHQEGKGNQLGAFGGWTVTDGLLLHAEGMIEDLSTNTDHHKAVALLGWNYTLEAGPTLTMEYLYNGHGYSTTEAKKQYNLRRRGPKTTSPTDNRYGSDLAFQRSHYLMLQMSHRDSSDIMSLTGRWLLNMEDNSSQLYGNVLYSLNDHLELFTTALLSFGDDDTEFGSLFTYQVNVGVRFVL